MRLRSPVSAVASWGLKIVARIWPMVAILIVTATLGTTLAPWGLSFIQSYAVDKKLTVDDLRYERLDVILGSVLTGVICLLRGGHLCATLHVRGVHIDSAADAAEALAPLAGSFAHSLFALGIMGPRSCQCRAPLSTAYSHSEFTGQRVHLTTASAVLRSSMAAIWVWRGWLQ